MAKGVNSYEPKERRKVRRKNHIAKDLGKPKYHQRVREGKRPPPPEPEIDDEWE